MRKSEYRSTKSEATDRRCRAAALRSRASRQCVPKLELGNEGGFAIRMLSIVIPVLNEEDSLLELYRQIDGACSSNGVDAEVVFVDDG